MIAGMLFTSLPYLALLVATFICTHLTPIKWRWIIWLIASVLFYMYVSIGHLFLLVVIACTFYVLGLALDAAAGNQTKRVYIFIGSLIALDVLGFFKYGYFFVSTINPDAWSLNILEDVALPLGISFYTFQMLGYIIDVYRKEAPAIRNPFLFLGFVSFFPQLIAGPIERTSHLVPQMTRPKRFATQEAKEGLLLLLWGFFKKLVLADRIGLLVDPIFADPLSFDGWTSIMASVLFYLQIYCDFSGYIDIGRGTAKMLGMRLSRNFNKPYMALSVRDFWRRWNITLSNWFRDYIYIPLGGSKTSSLSWVGNIIIVFTLSGIWHGAGWNFILWGILHGMWICLERGASALTRSWKQCSTVRKVIRWIITFCFLCGTFTIFRLQDMQLLADMLYSLVRYDSRVIVTWIYEGNNALYLLLLAIFAPMMILLEILYVPEKLETQCMKVFYWPCIVILLLVIFNFGVFEQQEFIYFQF